jgi:hypothetical protein
MAGWEENCLLAKRILDYVTALEFLPQLQIYEKLK